MQSIQCFQLSSKYLLYTASEICRAAGQLLVNPVGSLQSVEHANATATDYQYDALNRLTLLRTWDATGQLIQRQQFHLGAAGHREMVVEIPERVVEYSYDALYRLTEEQVTDPNGDRTTTYSFDATGNRLSRVVSCDPACTGEVEAGTTTYVYDANDRLIEETGPAGITAYSYDANGNTTRKTSPDGIVDYDYNADDRLTRAAGELESTASEVSYSYDAHGIRQSQEADGVVSRFLVDPTHQYAQVLEELDGAGNPTALYVMGHERISQERAEGYFTYHGDGLGSIRHLTDENGLETDRFVYEAFGLLEHREGATPNSFHYTGEQYDPNLGFYYLRARYYDPATGRFPTMDTYQGRIHEPQTLHKYLYVHADPVNNIDPSGEVALNAVIGHITVLATISGVAHGGYQIYQGNYARGAAEVTVSLLGGGVVKLVWVPARAIRMNYVRLVGEMRARQNAMSIAGKSSEEIARTLVIMRNSVKLEARSDTVRELGWTGRRLVEWAERRNVRKYGNSLGPTAEELVTSGKSMSQIVEESALRTNQIVNYLFAVF